MGGCGWRGVRLRFPAILRVELPEPGSAAAVEDGQKATFLPAAGNVDERNVVRGSRKRRAPAHWVRDSLASVCGV